MRTGQGHVSRSSQYWGRWDVNRLPSLAHVTWELHNRNPCRAAFHSTCPSAGAYLGSHQLHFRSNTHIARPPCPTMRYACCRRNEWCVFHLEADRVAAISSYHGSLSWTMRRTRCVASVGSNTYRLLRIAGCPLRCELFRGSSGQFAEGHLGSIQHGFRPVLNNVLGAQCHRHSIGESLAVSALLSMLIE